MGTESHTSSISRIANIGIMTAASLAAPITMPIMEQQVAPYYYYMDSVSDFQKIEYADNSSTKEVDSRVEDMLCSFDRLRRISGLGNNWNGDGAGPFDAKLVESVKNIIPKLIVQPEIFPTGRGSIQLEYNGINESYLEIEIKESDTAMVFMIEKSGAESEKRIQLNEEIINAMIKDFYA